MPVYHVNVRTASHIANTHTVERDDLTAIRLEMARFAGHLLSDQADQIWVDQEWQIDETDGDGLILYVLHVGASETAATRGTLPSA